MDIEIVSDIGCSKYSPSMISAWCNKNYLTILVETYCDDGKILLNKEDVSKLITGLQNMLDYMD